MFGCGNQVGSCGSGGDRRGRGAGWRGSWLAAAVAASCLGVFPALGQVASPVYVDDAPRSAAVLAGLKDLGPDRNLEDAARAVQSRLDEEPLRVLPAPNDPELFITVRARAHAALLANPKLLERYRVLEEPTARRLLDAGRLEEVETSRFLTPSGFEATLRLAQLRLEAAQFAAAAIALESLDAHPDRIGPGARDAAALLELVVRYLGDADADLAASARTRLARWRADAKLPPSEAGGAVRTDDPGSPVFPRVSTPYAAAGAVELRGLLPRPLWSDFTGESAATGASRSVPDRAAARQIPADAQALYTMPLVAGDAVYLNSGQSISAWNRFTLSVLWRVRVDIGRSAIINPPRDMEEALGLACDGERVIALTGLPIQYDQAASRRALLALDAQSGRVLWTRTVDELGDPALQESMLSGPPIIDQGVIVLTAIKQVPRRRLNSAYMIGVDAATGRLLWTTQLGSMGALPYGVRPLAGDLSTVRAGVAYRSDRIGFISAVETATGRLLWLRKMEAEFYGQGQSGQAWDTAAPVWHRGRLFTLTPDRREIVALDAATGAILAREPAGRWNSPRYLLFCAGRLIGVTPTDLYASDAEGFGNQQPVNLLLTIDSPGIRGRVVACGDRLLAPTARGFLMIPARAEPGTPPEEVELDEPGLVLPLDGQVIVADDVRLHTYLLWDAAEQQLRARMQSDPGDPMAGVTFAELSFRADRPAGIVAALDHALSAIAFDPSAPRNEQGRGRLFRSVLEMIEPSRGAPLGARLDNAAREALLERLSRAASLPIERVAYGMAAGRFYESTDQPERAVQEYQGILQNPALAGTTFTWRETTVPADDEAASRLRRVVREHGRAVYAGFEAEAEQRFASAAASLGPEPFEAVAREFPVSRVAARAWSEAATRYESRGQPQLAAWALEEGLRLAQEALERDDPLVGELGGRLVMQLVRAGRLYPAVAALERLLLQNPSASLSDRGRPIDAKNLLDDLRARLAEAERRPRLGTRLSAGPELPGVILAQPADPRSPYAGGPRDRVMMLGIDSSLSMWKIMPSGELAKVWDGVRNEAWQRSQGDAVYLIRPIDEKTERDFVFVRRHADTGAVVWETPGLRRLIRGRWEDVQTRFDLPLENAVDADELVYAFDDQTLVVGTINGGVAAIDLESGKPLWRQPRVIDRLHDLCLVSGTLVVGGANVGVEGDAPPRAAGEAGVIELDTAPGRPVVVSLDARSGQTIQRLTLRADVRWLVPTPEGELIVGAQDGLLMLDVFRGRVKWQAQSKDFSGTAFAAVAPGRILVKGEDEQFWQIDTETGKVRPQEPLDTRERLSPGYRFVEVFPAGDHLVLATRRGMVLYNRAGEVVGVDTGTPDQSIVAPAMAQDHIVTIADQSGEIIGDSFLAYELTLWSTRSAKAVASVRIETGETQQPTRVEVVEGKILVSFGSATRVIEAPPEGPQGR